MGSTSESEGCVRKQFSNKVLQKAKRGSRWRKTTAFLLLASREPKYPCIASFEVHSGGIQGRWEFAPSLAGPVAHSGNNGNVACRN